MKPEVAPIRLTHERIRIALAAAFFVASAVVLAVLGFATWLLLLAFCLLLVAIGLLWSSVANAGQDDSISLEEALDLGAPARDEERKIAVLRGIKDLEYERGLGKVSKEDYEQLMLRYRREAKSLLERLDTSEVSLRQKATDMVEERLRQVAPQDATRDNPA